MPLVALQNALGVIYLVNTNPEQGFPEDNIHLLNSVAGIAAVTLENILMLESLRDENRRLREELTPEYPIIGESKSYPPRHRIDPEGGQRRFHGPRTW